VPPSLDAAAQAGITDVDVLGATDYYRNRCVNDGAGTRALFSHRAASVGWDAFHLAESLLTTPMIVVIGDKPGGFGAYRDAPPGFRIWCGATVEASDVTLLTQWLDWAYAQALADAQQPA